MQKMFSLIDKKLHPINPVQFGYEHCKSSHHFGPAVRPFTLIHFVVSGSGIFKIRDKTYTLSKGDMFVIPPDVETYYEASAETPWSYIWIGFECSFPLDLEDKITCPEAKSTFETMKECEKFSTGRNTFLVSKIWELFAVLENRNEEKSSYTERAKSIIHSEYMMDVSVAEIAKRLSIDRSYFCSVFKKDTGLSPLSYIMEYRMNIASKLLREEKTSVTTTAYSVGYKDVFNFSKAFKKYYKKSPLEYKRSGG